MNLLCQDNDELIISSDIPLMWREEHKLFNSPCDGKKPIETIAGVDEAGRGPLAGPLVVSAVILPKYVDIPGLNDSKKLTEKKREELMPIIKEQAISYSIIVVDVETIDRLNILRATHFGMRESIKSLDITPDIALIDGLPLPDSPVRQVNLVKGDGRSLNIAAASVLAKVTRDHLMLELDAMHPEYGFKSHKGYPTASHLAKLKEYGILPCHRRSYAPVKELLTQLTLEV